MSKLEKLQKEVTSGQENTSREVVKKIEKHTYQFHRKGNKEQFRFNASVEEHMKAAKELWKLTTTNEGQKAKVHRTAQHLDKGTKTIAVQRKHIRIVDRSDLGWAEAYMDHELTSDLDKRNLFKASCEAQQTAKRKRAKSTVAVKVKRRAILSGEPQSQESVKGSSQRQLNHKTTVSF